MEEPERWDFLVDLDESLLKGGAILSEKSSFLIRNADLAFVASAHLACILTAMAAIETHLRAEWNGNRLRLVDLIDSSGLEEDLVEELHVIRRIRNAWVHVDDPWDDQSLIDDPESAEAELFGVAKRAVVALRRTIYNNPWI
jgi:hypothetical protein